MENQYFYKYKITALTGEPGFCDKDFYSSDEYFDEQKCLEGLNSFVPNWLHFRAIRKRQIRKYDVATRKEISRYNI